MSSRPSRLLYNVLFHIKVFPASQQQEYGQPDRTQTNLPLQEQHTGSTYLFDGHSTDAYTPASSFDGIAPDAQHEQQSQLELAYDWTKEAAAPGMQTAHNRSAEADAPAVPAETLKYVIRSRGTLCKLLSLIYAFGQTWLDLVRPLLQCDAAYQHAHVYRELDMIDALA